MIKKIERPSWIHGTSVASMEQINKWFDELVEPINRALDNAIPVKGCFREDRNGWSFDEKYTDESTTHSALLINIEPIKEETDRELLEAIIYAPDEQTFDEARARAKAALEREP